MMIFRCMSGKTMSKYMMIWQWWDGVFQAVVLSTLAGCEGGEKVKGARGSGRTWFGGRLERDDRPGREEAARKMYGALAGKKGFIDWVREEESEEGEMGAMGWGWGRAPWGGEGGGEELGKRGVGSSANRVGTERVAN
jgi:hypothetical protein